MRHLTRLLALSLCAAFAATPLFAEEAILLTPKWPVGKTFIYRATAQQTQNTMFPGMPQPMQTKVKQVQEYALSVKGTSPEGERMVKMQFNRIQMTMDMAGNLIEFDTDKPLDNESQNPMQTALEKSLGRMKDIDFTFYLNSENEITRMDGLEGFIQGMREDMGPQADAFSEMFGEENFRQMYGQLFTQGIPKTPVKPGDTWPLKTDMKFGPTDLSVDHNYTFAGTEQKNGSDCARLEYEGEMGGTINVGPAGGGMHSEFKSGRITGHMLFDIANGITVENKTIMELALEFQIPTPQQGIQTGTSEMRQEQMVELVGSTGLE